MKKIMQITHDELVTLIKDKLEADGVKDSPEVMIEFVTSAKGETSALITDLVQEEEPPTPAETEDSLLDAALRTVLTKRFQTQATLRARLMKELEGLQEVTPFDVQSIWFRRRVTTYMKLTLRDWEADGHVQYQKLTNSWKRVSKPPTVVESASDILEGSGGVMDRSDALSTGVANDKNR